MSINNNLIALPDDKLVQVLSYLDQKELSSVCCTHSKLSRFSNDFEVLRGLSGLSWPEFDPFVQKYMHQQAVFSSVGLLNRVKKFLDNVHYGQNGSFKC